MPAIDPPEIKDSSDGSRTRESEAASLLEEAEAAAASAFQLCDPSEAEAKEMAAPAEAGGSLIQRLIRMTVPERVKAALAGTRYERLLLIRDQNRIVQRAVIQSPQISERDVEGFAAMGNIGEEVLRLIAAERRFRRSARLPVLLAQNPHCPLDVTLELLKHLNAADLQKLVRNRMIGEQARRAAERELKRRKGK